MYRYDYIKQVLILFLCVYTVVTCPPLTAPDNGMNDCGEEAEFFDVCTFACDEGYKLSGSDSRRCEDDGTWSGTETFCTKGKVV